MSGYESRQMNPDRVVFFGLIAEEWVKTIRNQLVIPPADLLCLALALEQTSQNLRQEAARNYETPRA